VVNGVSLEIRGGEVVGLLGPNGAGKTTIFYMIVGLLRPNRGKMFLNHEEITVLPMYIRARKGIGYLPQEPSVFRKLTVEENLIAILESLPLSKEERKSWGYRPFGSRRPIACLEESGDESKLQGPWCSRPLLSSWTNLSQESIPLRSWIFNPLSIN
jgi:ABC-type Fe3+/spermidine/putrescine transport system ATPase subunit